MLPSLTNEWWGADTSSPSVKWARLDGDTAGLAWRRVMATGSPIALLCVLAPCLEGEQSWGHAWYGWMGRWHHVLSSSCHLPGCWLLLGMQAGLAVPWECVITGASSPASHTCCGSETLMLMSGKEQVNEEKPSAPFGLSAAFRVAFQWCIVGTSAFQPVFCAVECASFSPSP